MKTSIRWILVAAAILAVSAPAMARGGGGGGGGARGGGGGGGGGASAASRPAASRGSVRNSRPAAPAAQPATRPASRPADGPSTPVARPSTPAARSSAASARPETPVTRPSNAGNRPAQDFGRPAGTGVGLAAGAYLGSRNVPTGTRVGGSIQTLPAGSRPLTVGGSTYHYAGGVFYAPGAGGYGVVRAPVGAVVVRPLPGSSWRYWWGRRWYWYYGGVYYCDHDYDDTYPDDDAEETPPDPLEYEVVEPTIGVTVPYLPEGAKAVEIGGQNLFEYEGTYYKPILKEGEVAYMVVAPPL